MYDDNMEIIEHQKKPGKLKNTESIRNIPLNPRLKKLILKKKMVKKIMKKLWCYIIIMFYIY